MMDSLVSVKYKLSGITRTMQTRAPREAGSKYGHLDDKENRQPSSSNLPYGSHHGHTFHFALNFRVEFTCQRIS